ncbi:MAG: hypothetical protein ABIJ65_03190 [Chloroflexota bacterium]
MKKERDFWFIKCFTILVFTILTVGCAAAGSNQAGTGTDMLAEQNTETGAPEVTGACRSLWGGFTNTNRRVPGIIKDN